MKTCRCCKGTYKRSKKNYIIETRIGKSREIVIDDLNTDECNICGHYEYTDDSLDSIRVIKEHIMNYKKSVPKKEGIFSQLKKMLKIQ